MRRTSFAVIPALAIGLGGLAAGVSAFQESTPPAGGAAGGPAHPFALHTGSCEQPSEEAAFTFDGVVGPQLTDAGEPVGDADVLGSLTTPPLLQGSGGVDAPLEELLSDETPYVLAVHESEAEFDTLLACGEVAGALRGGQVTLALRPVGDVAYAGIAALGANAEGGTEGTVLLFAEVDAFADGAAERGNNRTPRAGAAGAASGGGGTGAGGGGGAGTGGGGRATQAAGTGGETAGGSAPAVTGGTSGGSTAPAVIGVGTDETPAPTAAVTPAATSEATAAATEAAAETTRTPGPRRAATVAAATAAAAAAAAGGPTAPAGEPTAPATEPTATTEVAPEPTATTEVIAEPTATTEVVAEPTATTEVIVEPTTIVVEATATTAVEPTATTATG